MVAWDPLFSKKDLRDAFKRPLTNKLTSAFYLTSNVLKAIPHVQKQKNVSKLEYLTSQFPHGSHKK